MHDDLQHQSPDKEDRRRYRLPGGPSWRLAGATEWLRLRLGAVLERELEAGRGALWLPVFLGAGILIYFALPGEPQLWALGLATGLAVAGTYASRARIGVFRTLVLIAAVVAGATLAKIRTELVAAPMLGWERTAEVTGWIAKVETLERGARLLVRVEGIERVADADLPENVRVTTRADAGQFSVGEGIAALARIQPPPGPVRPGGYDFARAAFYERIGAVGFTFGAPKEADLGPPPLDIRLRLPIERLREGIARRIRAALSEPSASIAVALVTGDRRAIPEDIVAALRDSGLAHILAISGLHMVLVAMTAFWTIRALLALSPTLALTRPIKKWAAAAALAVAAFYLLISGASIATQRAFVMLAVLLVAVLLDRRAITLRNVSLAAIFILVTAPESLLTASFQMSFAAALALVAGYEALSRRRDRMATLSAVRSKRWLATLPRWIGGLALTSLIAGTATMPFAVYHFQRLAPLALLANIAAMPPFSVLVMPAALASMLLMPFGLEVVPLAVMQTGIELVVTIARTVADWSSAAGHMPAPPAAALLLVVLGLLWLALWQTSWRLLGLLPCLAGIVVAVLAPRPDIIVGRGGRPRAGRQPSYSGIGIGFRDRQLASGRWRFTVAGRSDPQ